MNAQEKAKLIERETNAFLPDERFGGLDTSSSPDFSSVPKEGFGTDRHGLNRLVDSGANGLRALADNPDEETIKRIADETGDADLAEHIKDETEGAIAEDFVRTHKNYYRCDENYELIREWLDERQLAFTLENIDLAFKTLTRAGQLETRPGQARNLENHELLHVISLCRSGDLESAISQFLDYSFPLASKTWSDSADFVQDERSLPTRNAATRFVFIHGYNAKDTQEFRRFEKEYFNRRSPIRTVQDYVVMAEEFAKQQQAAERERIVFGPDQPSQVSKDDLNNLSDDQVNALTQRTLQARAGQLVRAR